MINPSFRLKKGAKKCIIKGMFSFKRFALIGLVPIIIGTGCYSIDTATTEVFRHSHLLETDAKPLEHVIVANYGWYLFNIVPIVCGDPNTHSKIPWLFFEDGVTTDIVHDGLTRYAADRHADVCDLNLLFNDNVLLTIPGLNVPVPMPYVLTYRERLVSGILVERKQNSKAVNDKGGAK